MLHFVSDSVYCNVKEDFSVAQKQSWPDNLHSVISYLSCYLLLLLFRFCVVLGCNSMYSFVSISHEIG